MCIRDSFQGVVRSTHAYDESTKDIIAGEYARYTHRYHGCSPDIVKQALLSAVDLLWADPGPPQAA
jgi:hypothetical protein